MTKYIICFLIILFALNYGRAQVYPDVTSTKERLKSFEKSGENGKTSIFANLPVRSVGPTVCSGRVSDVDVNPDNPIEFYVAFASGGLWKTTNNGQSFVPLFENEATMTIGDIAVDWKNGETIWVGTGEANAFLFAGLGVYKSTDKGKTWEHLGLEETQHISDIVIHPENPDIVWVSSPGHLWSANKERGIFKTTDGGKTWKHVLYIDDMTGVNNVIRDPSNANILYASAWHRMRRPWKRIKSGESSGIYKTTDGGENWELITNGNNGFPKNDNVGRIGISLYPENPSIIYAILDNQAPKEIPKPTGLFITRDELKTMSKGKFLALEEKLIENYMMKYRFPAKYKVNEIKEMVRKDEIKPEDLANYVASPNDLEAEQKPITGAEVYRSDDAGKTWKKTNTEFLSGLFSTYGYVFDIIRVAPDNPDKIIVGGIPILASTDGGKTFFNIGKENVHVDHHALWINPKNSDHLINGNDGGINISYDFGNTWEKINNIPVSQLYTINYDNETPYNIYCGMQDNGVWYGPSDYKQSKSWYHYGHYPYKEIHGGDGMMVHPDPRNNDIVISGSQYGYYYLHNKKTGSLKSIQPQHKLGEYPLRFNWNAPIMMSPHNQDIVYLGSHKLHRSFNQGETFEPISGDLTRGGKPGDVDYGTLTAIDESPHQFGLIYTGADDGFMHVSRDGGNTWESINKGLPGEFWVNNIETSIHKKERVYVSLNGYRWDNSEPHVYVSENYGETWTQIGKNLPIECVYVIKEDPANENILYVGTQNGLFISIDKGNSFFRASSNQLPNVAVFDLAVNPVEKELLIGTHGRSAFIANVEHIQKLSNELIEKELVLFEPRAVSWSASLGKSWSKWSKPYQKLVDFSFYLKNATTVTINIISKKGSVLKTIKKDCTSGINYITYDLRFESSMVDKHKKEVGSIGADFIRMAMDGNYYLYKGTYSVEISANGNTEKQDLYIK